MWNQNNLALLKDFLHQTFLHEEIERKSLGDYVLPIEKKRSYAH